MAIAEFVPCAFQRNIVGHQAMQQREALGLDFDGETARPDHGDIRRRPGARTAHPKGAWFRPPVARWMPAATMILSAASMTAGQPVPTRADSSVHHARSWIGSATMATGMATDTRWRRRSWRHQKADCFSACPDFLDPRQNSSMWAPAAPLGNTGLSLARGRAIVYVVHDKDLSICPASAGHFFWFLELLISRVIKASAVRGGHRSFELRRAIAFLNFHASSTRMSCVTTS